MNSYRFTRRLNDGATFILGHAVETSNGWRFLPNVSGRHPSRKAHSTMEECLPQWIGYPDHCESVEVK